MFPMTLTLTIQTAAQLSALAAIAGQGAELAGAVMAADATAKAQTSAKTPTPPTPTKAQTVAAKAKVEAGEPLTAAEAPAALHGNAVPETKPEAPVPSTAVTYEEAAAMVTKVSRTKGRDAAVAVLATFGAIKLSEVTPDKFADVVIACGQALI